MHRSGSAGADSLQRNNVAAEDHFGVLPEYINWSHVNMVIDARRKLEDAANILSIKVED